MRPRQNERKKCNKVTSTIQRRQWKECLELYHFCPALKKFTKKYYPNTVQLHCYCDLM